MCAESCVNSQQKTNKLGIRMHPDAIVQNNGNGIQNE